MSCVHIIDAIGSIK